MVKQMDILQEARFLRQNLPKVRPLPSAKIVCSARDRRTMFNHRPIDVEPVFWNAFISVLTFEEELEEGFMVEVGLGKSAGWELGRDSNLEEFINGSNA
jgi:hypothetical protein